jgi:RimJ/RimL family protein N-acetyltransferase
VAGHAARAARCRNRGADRALLWSRWLAFIDYWPLQGLRLTTPRLELRLPTTDELGELADLAADGVHDPAVMPFSIPWTDLPPLERGRSVLQHSWRLQAEWTAERWTLGLGVFEGGTVVGYQTIGGRDFGRLREVSTGSWLGLRHQGRGVGTEMRAAVLALAFYGLGADAASTAAFEDNRASYRVSEKLGYEPCGIERQVVRDRPVTVQRLRLSRERWAQHETVPVTMQGLEPCLPLFGLGRQEPVP